MNLDNQSNKNKIIACADTIHDFYNDLKHNILFKETLHHYNIEENLKKVNILTAINAHKYSGHSSIETNLSKYIDSNIPPSIPYNQFNTTTYTDNKPFSLIIDDINDEIFFKQIGLICNSEMNNDESNKSINFIGDVSILSKDILCNLNTINKNSIKINGKLFTTNATKYDRGNIKIDSNQCSEHIDQLNVELNKTNNNLLELNYFKIINSNIEYEYNNITNNTITKQININDYVNNINNIPKDYGFFRTFFINLLNGTNKHSKITGGTKKLNINLIIFDKLKKYFENVYHLSLDNFITSKNDTYKFINILFDLKRAGDQIQVQTCIKLAQQNHNKYIFITNDIIAAQYAYNMKVPCIRTTAIGKKINKDEHRHRQLTFYNFNNIQDRVFDNNFFDRDTFINNKNKMKNFYNNIKRLQKYDYSQNINTIITILDTYIDMFLEILKLPYEYITVNGNGIQPYFKYIYIYYIIIFSIIKKLLKINTDDDMDDMNYMDVIIMFYNKTIEKNDPNDDEKKLYINEKKKLFKAKTKDILDSDDYKIGEYLSLLNNDQQFILIDYFIQILNVIINFYTNDKLNITKFTIPNTDPKDTFNTLNYYTNNDLIKNLEEKATKPYDNLLFIDNLIDILKKKPKEQTFNIILKNPTALLITTPVIKNIKIQSYDIRLDPVIIQYIDKLNNEFTKFINNIIKINPDAIKFNDDINYYINYIDYQDKLKQKVPSSSGGEPIRRQRYNRQERGPYKKNVDDIKQVDNLKRQMVSSNSQHHIQEKNNLKRRLYDINDNYDNDINHFYDIIYHDNNINNFDKFKTILSEMKTTLHNEIENVIHSNLIANKLNIQNIQNIQYIIDLYEIMFLVFIKLNKIYDKNGNIYDEKKGLINDLIYN